MGLGMQDVQYSGHIVLGILVAATIDIHWVEIYAVSTVMVDVKPLQ